MINKLSSHPGEGQGLDAGLRQHDSMEQVFAENGPLAELLPGYSPRLAQIEMAKAIEKTLNQKAGRLMVEAGTGTGKSLLT